MWRDVLPAPVMHHWQAYSSASALPISDLQAADLSTHL
jgi:hypothetical protein